MIKIIFWDFDGVILNSNEVRDNGFETVLKDFPTEQIEQLLTYHKQNGGLSRYVKFRYFFEHVRGEEVSEKEVNEWAAKFSIIMLNSLKDKTLLIPETNDFIEKNYLNYKMHIVSGSDQSELRELCKSLEIEHFFKSIHGSPTPKKKWVKELIEKHRYDPNECVLIGDSFNDWEAASTSQINFLAYNNKQLEKYNTINFSFS
jgi:phosphoglycolate phosphatase-like HAD superfamily hydrolase